MKDLTDAEVAAILHRATGMIAPVLDVLENSHPFGEDRAEAAAAHDTDGAATDDDAATHGDASTDGDGVADGDEDSFSDRAVAKVADSLAWVTNAASAPGSPKWEALDTDERTDWWVDRVGSLTAVLVAYPGVFGAAADRLPIQDVLGFTQQAFVLCAVARVHGVIDRTRQTDLLAAVLCGRTITSATLLEPSTADDIEPLPAAEDDHSVARSARAVVKRIWSTAQLLRKVAGEAKRRPRPSRLWRTLSAVPVVGAAADYVGERSALKDAVASGVEWLRTDKPTVA
ncbi:hypothetical protein [Williamsia herbipolensis]|uniref:hypothetical protein n=1 Tax=Williamsia herbipolensis TaxID=1603258 RepID=UPI0005F7D183|nr:hypothetical protein [Williamsia herbipolensis]